uniref:Uncharacterized protein n=1 Tax=Lygus hesperus TaxID=30085 RepID=A0A146M694_LYGHE
MQFFDPARDWVENYVLRSLRYYVNYVRRLLEDLDLEGLKSPSKGGLGSRTESAPSKQLDPNFLWGLRENILAKPSTWICNTGQPCLPEFPPIDMQNSDDKEKCYLSFNWNQQPLTRFQAPKHY